MKTLLEFSKKVFLQVWASQETISCYLTELEPMQKENK